MEMDQQLQQATRSDSPGVILEALALRLVQAAVAGPAMNARPHHSRQRVDLLELAALGLPAPQQLLRDLIATGKCEIPALVPLFEWPARPQGEWPPEAERALDAWRRQQSLLGKLRNLAADAVDYHEDHGENALAIGCPLLSIPPRRLGAGRGARILAPLAFLPLALQVRGGARPGITLSLLPRGPGRLVPNELLSAFLERETGTALGLDECDDDPADPWLEVHEITRRILAAAGVVPGFPEAWDGLLSAVPRLDDLPPDPSGLPSAVMGLFPMHHSGILRDLEWMRENAADLGPPAALFLSARALAGTPAAGTNEPAPEPAAAQEECHLVAPADPSQTAAVWRARDTGALVIHGPPGTGKSQTIANLIGDHLARGERVLFVSDKRTALDVVKHRLDALGIGHLCGVVHDAAADRQGFYRALRQQLDALPESLPPADHGAEWARLHQQWIATRAELAAACQALHGPAGDGSFHDLVGRWLIQQTLLPATPDGTWPAGYGLAELDQQRAALEETLRRAARARFPDNPWRGWQVAAPEAIAAVDLHEAAATLLAALDPAETADTAWPAASGLLAELVLPLAEFSAAAAQLRESALALGDLALMADDELCARYAAADPALLRAYQDQADRLAGAVTALTETPLDAELFSALPAAEATLTLIGHRQGAVRKWHDARGVARWFRFLHAGAARRALAPLGLPLDAAGAARGLGFYQALHLRLTLRRDLGGSLGAMPADDAIAQGWRARQMLGEVLLRFVPGALLAACGPAVRQALAQPRALAGLVRELDAAAQRLAAGAHWAARVVAARVLAERSEPELAAAVVRGTPLAERTRAWHAATETLPDLARLAELFAGMPPALAAAATHAALAAMTWEAAQPAFLTAALAKTIRDRLAADPILARLDADAMESATATLRELAVRRRDLVRDRICSEWLRRQRGRLLAGTGTRLGAAGAALRQRLFLRGQHALRMRAMIAAGRAIEGGDPLFELCPVWMASPATVAQILPRQALFDTVIFDEASQCRLEETLPVLLRAKRVVIAGDTQQLPPTRFFEAALERTEDSAIKDADDLFEKRQLGAEDLLSAALNVEMDEVFLDVHYRSRQPALIDYSNRAFYQSRLRTAPAVFAAAAAEPPLVLHEVAGIYQDRGNPAEAARVVGLVASLLDQPAPPSLGIACFNLPQRDLILAALEERAELDPAFGRAFARARTRQGESTFEGLFVRNLENVQGDERDVMILSTTFGPDENGVFRRQFGVLNRPGGGRRLNVLVTRARRQVHVVTSVPRAEFAVLPAIPPGSQAGGRYHLYAYLAHAAGLAGQAAAGVPTQSGAATANALAERFRAGLGIRPLLNHGSAGLRIDVALDLSKSAPPASGGVLVDFPWAAGVGDTVAWDLFRGDLLTAAGWKLRRTWSTDLFRRQEATLAGLVGEFRSGAGKPVATAAE
jgi:hypothetical protein